MSSMTDRVHAAEWLARAWTSVVLIHAEATIELDQARAAAASRDDSETAEELAATVARHSYLSRVVWLFGKVVDTPPSSTAWTPELDSLVVAYVDALIQLQTALGALQLAVRNRPVQLRNAMMDHDLAAIEQLAAATVDTDEDPWELYSVHINQTLSCTVPACREAAIVERQLAQAVAARTASDLRHEPLADLDALMRQARYDDTGLRLGIGTGHKIRAGAPNEILMDSDTSTRPDVVADTPAMAVFRDATFRDVVCESALSGRTAVKAAGIREIHRVLDTGGGLTVYADADAGLDHSPVHIAALLRENGFDDVIIHTNNHLVGHPARYRMQRVTAVKPHASRPDTAPSGMNRHAGSTASAPQPLAKIRVAQDKPDETPRQSSIPERPPVVVRLVDLMVDKDPGHTSGFAERATRQILHDPSCVTDIVAELRTRLTDHLGERFARNSAGVADYEIERWLRHVVGGALHGAAIGRLARVAIDHLRHHATLTPENAGVNVNGGLPAVGGPATLLRRTGRFWVHKILSEFWDEIADDPGHRLHPLLRQTAAAALNTNTAGVIAFSHRQRSLAKGELNRTSHVIVPPTAYYASAKGWWRGSGLANWDITASYLIAHGIALQPHYQRRPTPTEFVASSGDLLRRVMNTSTMVPASVIPFNADPIALSLEKWETTSGNICPYAIHLQSPIFRAVTENSPKAGTGEPPRRTGHCGGAIRLRLPEGPDRDALRELFLTTGIEPPNGTEFTAVAALFAFGQRIAMDTLYPNMPDVTVLDDDVLEGYRRLDAHGFERQHPSGTPGPGDAAHKPYLGSVNPSLWIRESQASTT